MEQIMPKGMKNSIGIGQLVKPKQSKGLPHAGSLDIKEQWAQYKSSQTSEEIAQNINECLGPKDTKI